MALVFMGSHGWGTLFIDPSDIEAGVGLQSSFTNAADATAATHYADSAGSSPSTGPVTADANGRLTRWIEEGTYNQTLPGGTIVEVQAVSGTSGARRARLVVNIQDYTDLDDATDNTLPVNDLIADLSALGSANRKRRIEVGDGDGLVLRTKGIVLASNIDLDLGSCHVKKLQGGGSANETSFIRTPETLLAGSYYGTYSNIRVAGGNFDPNGIDTNVSFSIRTLFVEGLELDGLTLLGYWPTTATWAIAFGGRNVLCKGCKVRGGAAVFQDGLHFAHGSDCTITDYDIECGDDGVAIGGEPGGFFTTPDHVRGVTVGPGTVRSEKGFALKVYSNPPGIYTQLKVEDVKVRGLVGRSGISRNGGVAIIDQSVPTAPYNFLKNIDVEATVEVGGASHSGVNPMLFWADGVNTLRARVRGRFATSPTPLTGMYLRRLEAPDVDVRWVEDGLNHAIDRGSGLTNSAITAKRLTRESQKVRLFDDFLGDLIADEWAGTKGTDAEALVPVATAVVGGSARLTTGDDAAATMAVNGSRLDTLRNFIPSSPGLFMEARVAMSAITNVCVFIGFTGQAALLQMPFTLSGTTLTANTANACGFLFDTDATVDNWKMVGVDTSVAAAVQDAGVAPVANTNAIFRIEVDTTGQATFFYNGAMLGTAMADATAVSVLTPVVAAFSRAAASRTIDVDYILVESDR